VLVSDTACTWVVKTPKLGWVCHVRAPAKVRVLTCAGLPRLLLPRWNTHPEPPHAAEGNFTWGVRQTGTHRGGEAQPSLPELLGLTNLALTVNAYGTPKST